jgi:hypothetical protein
MDRRDVPFKTFALGPSSGQEFRRRGVVGKDFALAIGDIQAMSNRFRVVQRENVEMAFEIMRKHVIKYIQPGAGDFHGYSTGRLAATIGRWDPTQFVQSEAAKADELRAIEWAQANIPDDKTDSSEELTIIEKGAYSSAKRWRANTWVVEMGTFTPYAGLVEDGGSMMIADYGNPNVQREAHWEANHMFKRGMFDAYVELEQWLDQTVKNIVE